ncbi:MAG: hypothetical protein ACJAX4_000317 [Clostridium sp.]|jgi:hypothetical protein
MLFLIYVGTIVIILTILNLILTYTDSDSIGFKITILEQLGGSLWKLISP